MAISLAINMMQNKRPAFMDWIGNVVSGGLENLLSRMVETSAADRKVKAKSPDAPIKRTPGFLFFGVGNEALLV
jgi:hypothetical protein